MDVYLGFYLDMMAFLLKCFPLDHVFLFLLNFFQSWIIRKIAPFLFFVFLKNEYNVFLLDFEARFNQKIELLENTLTRNADFILERYYSAIHC